MINENETEKRSHMIEVDRITKVLDENDIYQIMRSSAVIFMQENKEPFLREVWKTNMNEHLVLSEVMKDFLYKREPGKIQHILGKEGVEIVTNYLITSLKLYIIKHKPTHIELVI